MPQKSLFMHTLSQNCKVIIIIVIHYVNKVHKKEKKNAYLTS